MPYKIETDGKRLPKSMDRRIKLTHIDRIKILSLIDEWFTDTEIGDIFNVNRKSIWNIRNPEKHEEAKKRYKELRKDGRYYNKKENTNAVRDTRRYRQSIKEELI